MPLINHNQTSLEKLGNTKFKNLTLTSRALKLTDATRDFSNSLNHSMNELDSAIHNQTSDVEASPFKQAKNIRTLIRGHSDLLSNLISNTSKLNQDKIDRLYEIGKPKTADSDVFMLQMLVSKGDVDRRTLMDHPELSNVIANSDMSNYLFGDEIVEFAKETAFKFNLGDQYKMYQDELATKELINDFEVGISKYITDTSAMAETAVIESDPSINKELSTHVLGVEPSSTLEGSGQAVTH